MTTKHTPGPWVLTEETHYTPGCGYHPHIVGADGKVVMDGTWYSSVPDIENIRIIAAAPVLLEDLKVAAALLRKYETLHRAKGTDESTAKAEVNAELAGRFERTIALATLDTNEQGGL